MRKNENKSMFGAWMVLFMSIVMLFTACEKLDEDLSTKSDSKRDNTPKYSVQNKEREVTGPTTEECRFEKVTQIGDQKTIKKYSYTLKRSLKGIEEYRKEVSGFGYEHKSNNPMERGEASEVRTEDGVAKFSGRTDKLSGNKENGFETDKVVMPYDFYHERLEFNDGDVSVVFDFEEVSFSDKVTKVEPITSPVTGKEAARLSNTISTKYIGYSQDASESVVLLMEKGVTIVSEDFVTSTEKETVTDNNVTAYILYRVNKSDGTHEDYPLEFSDSRDGKEDNPWTVIQASNSQTTSYVQRSDAGSTDKSDNKDGATAKWKRYKYVLTSVTTFPDGTTKDNVVRTTEPEGWEITFRGKTHTFKRPTYSQTNTRGSVSGGSEVDGYKVYDFVDKFSYSRGSNTKNFSPKGTIKVKKSEPTFFPEDWGKLKNIKQTVANNESHNGFVYTWLLEFEENVKLPVVVRPGSNRPEWHFEYAEVTTVSNYNGGTYDKATNTWICTTASDKPNQMVWSRNSKEKANKDYSVARNQNWDEGHTVDGHPSTQTSRYQLTVSSDGRLTAKDTYTGTTLGNWK